MLGNLVATALAEDSSDRRARRPVGAAESLATVPLLTQRFARQGIEAPVTTGLQRVLDGEASADQWLESVRSSSTRDADRSRLTRAAARG